MNIIYPAVSGVLGSTLLSFGHRIDQSALADVQYIHQLLVCQQEQLHILGATSAAQST
jgi:hypothetical protein